MTLQVGFWTRAGLPVQSDDDSGLVFSDVLFLMLF